MTPMTPRALGAPAARLVRSLLTYLGVSDAEQGYSWQCQLSPLTFLFTGLRWVGWHGKATSFAVGTCAALARHESTSLFPFGFIAFGALAI